MRKSRSSRGASPPDNPLVRALASRLAAWRKQRGLPLKAVAEAMGVSVAIVCEWENGHRFPSAGHLQALAEHTGIPAWRLIEP